MIFNFFLMQNTPEVRSGVNLQQQFPLEKNSYCAFLCQIFKKIIHSDNREYFQRLLYDTFNASSFGILAKMIYFHFLSLTKVYHFYIYKEKHLIKSVKQKQIPISLQFPKSMLLSQSRHNNQQKIMSKKSYQWIMT